MIINNKPIRFIHIEKSGGTSVRNFLLDNKVDFLMGKNSTITGIGSTMKGFTSHPMP